MKFMMLSYIPIEKLAEVSATSDRVWTKARRVKRTASTYLLLSVPFDVPANSHVTFNIFDADSAEEIAAIVYPIQLAGASIDIIPLLEVPVGGTAKAEEKYRG